jgi:hypothetical protein
MVTPVTQIITLLEGLDETQINNNEQIDELQECIVILLCGLKINIIYWLLYGQSS